MANKSQKNVTVDQSNVEPEQAKPEASKKELFPHPNDIIRLQSYDYYERLFMGEHFHAFSIRIEDENYNKAYARIRYVMANFAGLLSRVVADMVFGEKPVITVKDGDQEFVDALIEENNLHAMNYESAISNSYFGDQVFKVRVGKRHPNDAKPTIIIEQTTPRIYFPKLNPFNVTGPAESVDLAWTFHKDGNKYLRKEIHEIGKITNKVYQMQDDQIMNEEPLSLIDATLKPEEETKIDRPILIHIPNFKVGARHFGISDYKDIDNLFFAINNRLSKVDNILDKHSDPILMVPPGILDEKGRVRKKALGVIEMQEGETGKPEYIVWDASLENAFKEIDKLVDLVLMMSETDRALFGLDSGGGVESGRALKLKLLRTIAKAKRKVLYYDTGIKETLYVAQLLAKEWNVEVGGKKLTKAPVRPDVKWMDGIPEDEGEQIEKESKRIDAGLTTKKDAIMRIDGVDDKTAEKKAKEIDSEFEVKMKAEMKVQPDDFDKGKGDK